MIFVNNGPQIKYDKRDQAVGLVIAAISTLSFLVSCFLMVFALIEDLNAKLIAMIVIGGVYFWPWLAIIGWRLFFSSRAYMKRLEKYGYKAPNRKKEYHGRQDLLERFEVSPPDVNKRHPESVSLALVAWIAGVCSIPYPFYVWQRFPDMDGMLIFMLFPVVCWGIMGVYYWRQRNQVKYKDDVELDEKRKTRQNLVDGLVIILVCAFLTFLFYFIMYNLAMVVYKSRLAAGWYQ